MAHRRLSQQRVIYHDHFGKLDRGQREVAAEKFAEVVEVEAAAVSDSDTDDG